MTIKTCTTCQANELNNDSIRGWYCTPPNSNKTTIKTLCLTDAIALEESGWTVVIVPTTAQRVAARRWDIGGIGAN